MVKQRTLTARHKPTGTEVQDNGFSRLRSGGA
jgi:hypothetical protein